MGHTRKHLLLPHGGFPPTPLRCPNIFSIVRNTFSPTPPDRRNFLLWGSVDIFWNNQYMNKLHE